MRYNFLGLGCILHEPQDTDKRFVFEVLTGIGNPDAADLFADYLELASAFPGTNYLKNLKSGILEGKRLESKASIQLVLDVKFMADLEEGLKFLASDKFQQSVNNIQNDTTNLSYTPSDTSNVFDGSDVDFTPEKGESIQSPRISENRFNFNHIMDESVVMRSISVLNLVDAFASQYIEATTEEDLKQRYNTISYELQNVIAKLYTKGITKKEFDKIFEAVKSLYESVATEEYDAVIDRLKSIDTKESFEQWGHEIQENKIVTKYQL